MRLSVLLATAAIAAAVPAAASSAVMVAHFDGVIGGSAGWGTGSTRLGFPVLYAPSGAFSAEVRYDPTLGSPVSAGVGGEGRNAAAILDGWIEFEGVRIELPSAEFGRVTSRPNGFSVQLQHYIPDVVLDSLTLNANFTGVGDLDLPVAAQAVTGGGSIQAASNYATGVFTIDLFGNCSYECGGMPLMVQKFSLSEYAAPSGAPEPSAWALMILGFGGAGAALRPRRTAIA